MTRSDLPNKFQYSNSHSRNGYKSPRTHLNEVRTPGRLEVSKGFASDSVVNKEDSCLSFRFISGCLGITGSKSSGDDDLVISSKGPRVSKDSSSRNKSSNGESLTLTLSNILKITDNFSPTNEIGKGCFGTVYRGTLDDGTLVAVKRASKDRADAIQNHEFENELRTLTQVEHMYLVKFIGYLKEDHERILLFEYVPNGNLREHLDCKRGNGLTIGSRLEIAIDVAHAITYLHTYLDRPIIHRDIKSSNILLTNNLHAKVSDFGLSKLGPCEIGVTHVCTQVKGTAGYIDPDYMTTFKVTVKSDVYSFGVLLVEIFTGRHAIEPQKVHEERITSVWAMKKYMQGCVSEIMDPKLALTSINIMIVEEVFELALQCMHHNRKERPEMEQCAKSLWNIRKKYKELQTTDSQLISP